MYTKKTIPILELILWSRRSLVIFFLISAIPVALFYFFDFKFLRLPWTPIAVFGTALAFVIGFKSNAAYGRMWEARQIWGGIVNASRSWGIMTRDFINNKHAKNDKLTNEELESVKHKIINRHIAWMTAHRYSLRTPKKWEGSMADKSNIEFMERLGHVIPEKQMPLKEALAPYLDSTELDYVMSKSNKATTLIANQSKHITDLEDKGHIWDFSYLQMKSMLVELFTLQGKNERIKNFPYPRQFATLNQAFIWIFVFILPFGLMGSFNSIGLDLIQNSVSDISSIKLFIFQNFIWLTIPFCMIVSWVFYSLEEVGATAENPFEGLPTDVPITTMSKGIEIDLLEILDNKNIPEPIAENNNVQM